MREGGYLEWVCLRKVFLLKKEHVDRVAELWRITDRIIGLKMDPDSVMEEVPPTESSV